MNGENTLPKPKKRIRQPTLYKKFLNKQKVQKGEEHFSPRGNVIPAKTFKVQEQCKCRKKCEEKIDVQRQYVIFQTFYKLESWSSKTLFLRGCVSRSEIRNRLSDLNPIRPLQNVSYNYTYKLLDHNGIEHEVCKHFFCTCLQITANQTNRAFGSIKSNPSAIERRGRAPPANKVPEDDILFVKQFIDRFPRYRSHYCRSQSNKWYLMPGMNLMKMYREYQIVCEFEERAIVTEHMFRYIFNTEFNIQFKRRHTDTCKTCDELIALMKNERLSYEVRKNYEEALKSHHIKCEEKTLAFQAD